MNRDAWLRALEGIPDSAVLEALEGRPTDSNLPWDEISLRVGRGFLKKEWDKARAGLVSRACTENCIETCGTCNDSDIAVYNKIQPTIPKPVVLQNINDIPGVQSGEPAYRLVMCYIKTGAASFLPHHSVIDLLYRAFQLSGIPVAFSRGFNPLPRLEIEDPIPLGMSSLDDYASVLLTKSVDPRDAMEGLNRYLPPDIRIRLARLYPMVDGKKTRSISSMLWGSDYRLEGVPNEAAEVISASLADPRLEGSAVLESSKESRFLVLRLRFAGIREIGFGSLFEKTFHEPFLRSPVSATRLRQWARSDEGTVEYFKAFDSFYNTQIT